MTPGAWTPENRATLQILRRAAEVDGEHWALLRVAIVELRDSVYIGRLFFGQCCRRGRVWMSLHWAAQALFALCPSPAHLLPLGSLVHTVPLTCSLHVTWWLLKVHQKPYTLCWAVPCGAGLCHAGPVCAIVIPPFFLSGAHASWLRVSGLGLNVQGSELRA